jgi:hypothetical protein
MAITPIRRIVLASIAVIEPFIEAGSFISFLTQVPAYAISNALGSKKLCERSKGPVSNEVLLGPQ